MPVGAGAYLVLEHREHTKLVPITGVEDKIWRKKKSPGIVTTHI